jgi:hypothetical protein
MFSFTPSANSGKVCINQGMPEDIKQRLKQDASLLQVLKDYQDREFSPSNRRYWCFPKYKPNLLKQTHKSS